MSNRINRRSNDDYVIMLISLFINVLIMVGIGIYVWHMSDAFPFGFWQFWNIQGSLSQAIIGAWPIYLWGAGLTALVAFTRWNGYRAKPLHIFTIGFLISLFAGVFEEIKYRWLLFFVVMAMIPLGDWLMLGFMGYHPIQWIYVSVICPVANFFTLGYLEPYLLNGYGWAVAAAIISVNGKFRNGHKYLGTFGYVNSWFLGMYFFWVVFHYGLIAAIIIHFLYDLFIFTVPAIDAVLENRQRTVFRRRT
ncbi:CPBP family intramembrane metalloprotease [Candidatus Kaiserbacteria bacterium]|nr:CPBP family intramembrane metalloprotease [Candidatus Kaiserbacteria bacterium]